MDTPAIEVRRLSKRYPVGGVMNHHRTLRKALTNLLSLRRGQEKRGSYEVMWALRDISFDVQWGEVLGVIGQNGAGKSTLLKILCNITKPSSGSVAMYGRVGALLEVGTGFHPELTGAENIFLSGTIIGMKRSEIRRQFDEIVAFADVGSYLDTPIKHYSSGMTVRLAFAVAAHLDTDILILDEVLAVSDLAFQQKCERKMREVIQDGRAVIYVSHNLGLIQDICPRSILLHGGQCIMHGPTERVIETYSGIVWDSEKDDPPLV